MIPKYFRADHEFFLSQIQPSGLCIRDEMKLAGGNKDGERGERGEREREEMREREREREEREREREREMRERERERESNITIDSHQ